MVGGYFTPEALGSVRMEAAAAAPPEDARSNRIA